LAVIGGLVAYRYYQNTASDQNTVSAQDVWNQYERSKGDINAVKKFIGKKKIHHINREIKGVSLKKNWLSFLYTIVTCCCDTRI
jgi:hypothetical protein